MASEVVFVVIQLVRVVSRARRSGLVGYGVFLGLLAGFISDGILVAAGT